jgi:thymidylate synthase (FAD)
MPRHTALTVLPGKPEQRCDKKQRGQDDDNLQRVHQDTNVGAVGRGALVDDEALRVRLARLGAAPWKGMRVAVEEIEFRSDVTVELVRYSASDADVLFAARVSTQGEQTLDSAASGQEASERDRGLINYLMRDRHGSPFEHNSMTFYVQAPIFVFREFMRHRIASYNEESGRYRELRPVFYVPGPDRKLVQVGKPGAYDFEQGTPEQTALVDQEVRNVCTEAYSSYQRMLEAGVAREVARAVLPVTLYSSMYVTMNARSLMNFLSLRTKREGTHFPSFPQREIEMVAEKMEALWEPLMPMTAATFSANGRVAP